MVYEVEIFLMEERGLFILYIQYDGCRCASHSRSQGNTAIVHVLTQLFHFMHKELRMQLS